MSTGLDGDAADQRRLIGNSWGGGSGEWCLIHKEVQQEGDERRENGDLVLLLEGTRLNVKAYKPFETCMDRSVEEQGWHVYILIMIMSCVCACVWHG